MLQVPVVYTVRRILGKLNQPSNGLKLANLILTIIGLWLVLHAAGACGSVKPDLVYQDSLSKVSTDLQLFSQAVQQVTRGLLIELPAHARTGLVLLPDERQSHSWIAEDALAREALELNIPVVMRQVEGDGVKTQWILYYRIVNPQAVYEPKRRSWVFFKRGVRRIARGSIFLRLTNQRGDIGWVREREIYLEGRPFEDGSDLAKSTLVEQIHLQVDNRSAELGLSAALIGGLFYIFFIL